MNELSSSGTIMTLIDRPLISLMVSVRFDLAQKLYRVNIMRYSSGDMNPRACWFLSKEAHLGGLLATIPVVQTTWNDCCPCFQTIGCASVI